MTSRRSYSSSVAAFAALVMAFILLPVIFIALYAFNDTGYFHFPPQGLSLKWFISFFANARFRAALEAGGMCISASDAAGELRAAELPEKRFYLVTLFQPQRSSTPERPHPIIVAYLEAALRYRDERLAAGAEPAGR